MLMFRSNRKSDTPAGRRGSFSILGSEVTVTGNISAGDLHLDGTVDGDVECVTLIVGEGGRIAGSVAADSARIAGTVEGAVATRELTVERTARIVGDIAYEAITIETGARVDGQLRRVEAEAKAPIVLEAKASAPRLLAADEKAA
jgi:cytoskeletal protein CcmA (bactofilin family)